MGRKSTLLKFCSDSYGLVVAILSDKEISVSYTTLEGVSKVSKKYSTDDMKSDEVIELAYSVIKEIVNECLKNVHILEFPRAIILFSQSSLCLFGFYL